MSLIAPMRRVLADTTARSLAALLPRRLMCAKRHFSLWERHGYHVTPVHYCEPIPEVHCLPDRLWHEKDDLVGIEMNDRAQLRLLDRFCAQYQDEYANFPLDKSVGNMPFHVHNGWFAAGDAEILYSFVRQFRPRRIIEIGSGYSTLVFCLGIQANKMENPHYNCHFISIEPHPRRELLDNCQHLSEQRQTRVQETPVSVFEKLGANDILFVDSSHIAACGSDVNHEFFRIIPNVAPGVFVHLHDIFIPFEYPQSWIKDQKLFWNEQYLVRAFLTFNSRFEVVWAANYMNQVYTQQFRAAIPSVRPVDYPASLWLRARDTD